MMRKLFLGMMMGLIGMVGTAQSLLTAYRGVMGDSYDFWVSTPPQYDSTRSYPLVVFLHGKSLCGNDLNRVRRYGPLDALAMGKSIDAIILAPQNRGGSWNGDKVHRTIAWTKQHYPIDSLRVYVIGMSMGGYGTIRVAAQYPNEIAAAMALCGGSNIRDCCPLNDLPLWIIHGSADRAVLITESKKVVSAMAQCGDTSRLRTTWLKGVNHSDLARIFYLKETYEWLFSHTLSDSLRPVNKEITLTTETMRKAYQDIDRNGKHIKVIDAQKPTATPLPSDVQSEEPLYHRVKKGDTLYGIARQYHTTVKQLCALNHIKESSILQIGQKIKVR